MNIAQLFVNNESGLTDFIKQCFRVLIDSYFG